MRRTVKKIREMRKIEMRAKGEQNREITERTERENGKRQKKKNEMRETKKT